MAKKKRKIAVIDCETDPFKYGRMPQPFLWGFYNGDEYKEFADTADIAAYLKDNEFLVYAHNGGKFDYHFLLPYLDSREKIMIINSRLAKWKLGKSELRDSYNILPVPLKQINKDEFDYDKMEAANRHEYMDEIRKYLQNDCIYLYDAIIDFIERFGLHLTQASASMKQWEQFGNEIPRTSGAYFESLKHFYYGGRVTPFKGGIFQGKFDIVDINSAYPFAMKHEHPWGLDRSWKINVPDCQLATSLIELECYSYGALPQRGEDGSLTFPEKFDKFYCTGHEFIAGLETGTIKRAKIIKAMVWNETITFKDYIDHFYKMKLDAEKKGDKAGRLFAKLFMNSLYGKFASNPARYREYIIDEYGNETPEGYAPDAICGHHQLFSRPLMEGHQHYYNVAVAASITGWVRAYLWRALQTVKTPLYCDTDSIICADKRNLQMGDELGQWAQEGVAKRVAVAGKKLYACELTDGKWKTASKGVRLTPQQIMKVASGDKILYKNDAPTFSLTRGNHFIERVIAKTI